MCVCMCGKGNKSGDEELIGKGREKEGEGVSGKNHTSEKFSCQGNGICPPNEKFFFMRLPGKMDAAGNRKGEN